MRLGLRGKLVTLLTVVALLPLVVAAITVFVGFRSLWVESLGQRMSSVAEAEAKVMQISLTKDIDKLQLLLHQRAVIEEVASYKTELSAAERRNRDADWPTRPDSDPVVRDVMACPLSDLLHMILRDDPRIAELFITDRYGQLIAATGRTSDYYQADEEWWQRAHAGGSGQIFIPPVNYDHSAAVWSVDLCVPIKKGDVVVGVAKVVLDVTAWIGLEMRGVGEFQAAVMLVGQDGRVILHPGLEPMSTDIESHTERDLAASTHGWWQTEGGEIQAGAPIRMPDRIGALPVEAPKWVIVLFMVKSRALHVVNRLSLEALAFGLAIVGVIFLVGLFLVDRSIVRRVRRLEQATHAVAAGDLTYRVELDQAGKRLLGSDEIDDLVVDFNRMVGQVQQSHDQLRAANELKSRFIKIASHELRTPVSYILGMAGLLTESDDTHRLREGVVHMGERARRLNEIIQAMFKLLPGQTYGEPLRYTTVNIEDLLSAIRRDSAPFVEARGQELVVDLPDETPDVQGDRGMLYDVIENLVMNAIKFTPDGGVVAVVVGQELGGRVSIAVKDQGPGIPQIDLPHIFEPFFSGGEVLQHSTGRSGYEKRGMGLGLAIVRHFVQLHAGTVTVSSGKSGTVFTVTIPIEPPPPRHRPERPGH